MLICAVAMLLIGAIVVLLLIIGRHQDREVSFSESGEADNGGEASSGAPSHEA